MHQTTLRSSISCTGIGLHGGREVRLTLRPAPADAGIVLALKDGATSRLFSPSPEAVVATELATTLGVDGRTVATVEHLLAALRGMGVDNVVAEVDGGEVPIMDGSARAFVNLIRQAGTRSLAAPRSVLAVAKPIRYENGTKWIRAEPWQGLFIDYTIDFPHPGIGRQRLALAITPDAFAASLAGARTFGFLRDVEALRRAGLALGGSLDNAVVLDDGGVLNAGGLRWADEFVRHKILDFLGDIAVLPLGLWGRFTVFASGHGFNNAFVRSLADTDALTPLTPARPMAPSAMELPRPAAM